MQDGFVPADPFPLRYLIYLEKGPLLARTLRGAPANLCELLNGEFYSRPLLEWQLSAAHWGKKTKQSLYAESSTKLMDF